MAHWIVAFALLLNTPLLAGGQDDTPSSTPTTARKSTVPILRTSSSDITSEDSAVFRDRVNRVCGNDPAQQTKFLAFLREVTPLSARKEISERVLSYLTKHRARFSPYQYVQLLDLLPEGDRTSKNLKLIESCLTPNADDAEKHWFIQALMEMRDIDMIFNLSATNALLKASADLSEREFILRVANLLPNFQKRDTNMQTMLRFLKAPTPTETEALVDAVKQIDPSNRLDVVFDTLLWLDQCQLSIPNQLKIEAFFWVSVLERNERSALPAIARALKSMEPLSTPTPEKKLNAEISILELLLQMRSEVSIRILFGSQVGWNSRN